MKSFTLKPRLHIYNITVGSYDILDKYKFSTIEFSKIKKINIYSCINKLTNNTLSFSFFKEFISKQCINLYQTLKISFLKKFVITLRSSWLDLYVEILFNTFFLDNKFKKNICKKYQYINIILNFTFNYFFINCLSEKFISQRSIFKSYIQIKFKNKHRLIQTFLSYYFIC